MSNSPTFGPTANLNVESVSAVTATPTVALGTRRHHGGCDWIYVYNQTGGATGETVNPGRVVALQSGATGYTVDAATPAIATATGAVAFGVVVNATLSVSSYGWVLTRGFCQLEQITGASALAVGEPAYLAVSGSVGAVATVPTGTGFTVKPFARSCETVVTTVTASFTAYVNCDAR